MPRRPTITATVRKAGDARDVRIVVKGSGATPLAEVDLVELLVALDTGGEDATTVLVEVFERVLAELRRRAN